MTQDRRENAKFVFFIAAGMALVIALSILPYV